ncbi:MAG: hypothetical protein DKINENOH_01903 [bacterium]|nr:hypothetical protein [bacterium]MCK6558452.1 hypothetical protein [bacterium]NUM65501.1 hypothetical protein [candidate division KSB1 bacterium]
MKLKGLAFDDCVIVGFSRDAARGTLTLTFEAYVVDAPIPQRDLYTLECSGVKEVRLQFSPEFPADLNRSYDPQGYDQRANEIHELRWDNLGYLHIVADMIQGSFHCQSCRLLRVVEIEAEA